MILHRKILALAAGLLVAAYMLLLWRVHADDPESLSAAVLSGSLFLLIATWLGRTALQDQHFSRLNWSSSSCLLAWMMVLAFGYLLLDRAPPIAIGMIGPVLHLLAAFLPALALIRWPSSDLPLTDRDRGVASSDRVRSEGVEQLALPNAFGWGALVATSTSALLQSFGLLVFGSAAWFWLGRSEAGQTSRNEWLRLIEQVESGAITAGLNPNADWSILLNPIALALLFGTAALLGPAIEELAKLSGVIRAPGATGREAFRRGAAVGAGFGCMEALLNGSADLTPNAWLILMLARAIVTVMHAAVSGLAAYGWYVLRHRNATRGFCLLVSAFALHALWNGLAIATALLGIVGLDSAGFTAPAEGLPGTNEAVGFGMGFGPAGIYSIILIGIFYVIFIAFWRTGGRRGPVRDEAGK